MTAILAGLALARIGWRHSVLLELAGGGLVLYGCWLLWLAPLARHKLCDGQGCRLCRWTGRRPRSPITRRKP